LTSPNPYNSNVSETTKENELPAEIAVAFLNGKGGLGVFNPPVPTAPNYVLLSG
jgi:hypothetical protein